MSDEKVRDFENTELRTGDIIVFTCGGYMGRGRIVELRAPGIFGALLVQSLIDSKRFCAVSSPQSVLIERAPLTVESAE